MNTPRDRYKAARTKLRDLHLNQKAALLEQRANRLEARGVQLQESASPTALDWVTAYTSILDRLRAEPYSYNVTSPYDRKFGRNFPIYQSEAELSLLRAPSRVLCQTNTYAQALLGGLKSYIIGPGYTYRAAAREDVTVPQGLPEAVQEVVEGFLRRNQWNNHHPWQLLDQLPLRPIEGEAFERTLRDGEVTLWHTEADDESGDTDVRFVEPEFITQPPGGSWEEWSFGWKVPMNDEQRKLAAWISFTGNPADGEEVPVDQLSYLARNSDRILKRGVPDFTFDAYDALSTAQRLRRALAVGGAVKASIVGVRQHKAQTQTQATAFQQALEDYTTIDQVTGLAQSVRRYNPGEWEDIPENLEYVRGPGTDVEVALIEVLAACLRGAVVRWNGFEWLVSADASNNSYANALAAKSPACQRVECEQADYKALFLRSIAIAVRNAANAGRIKAGGITFGWEDVRRFVEVQVEAPNPVVEDETKEAQNDTAYNQLGAKSVQTICQEQGLDYEREMQNIEEHQARFGQPGQGLEEPGDEPPGQGDGELRESLERQLQEDGYTGIDSHGHKWVNGKQVKRGDAGGGGEKHPLQGHVEQLAKTPAGRQVLHKGRQLAAHVAGHVKGAVTTGVKKALDGLDEETRNGPSMILGGVANRSPAAVAHGISQMVSMVYENVHQEIYELAMSDHSMAGAHLVGKMAGKGLAAAEGALLKATAWAMTKAKKSLGLSESLELTEGGTLSPLDEAILGAAAEAALDALRHVYEEAGVSTELMPTKEQMVERLAKGLTANDGGTE